MSDAETLIRRARLFEFYARHLWRFRRLPVAGGLRRRCARCAVSEAFSALDASGLCGECRKPAEDRPEAEAPAEEAAALERLLADHAGRGAGSHDALVMLSGGKDSALLVHELRRRHPRLRLLALTIDNGFMSPVALANCRRVVEKAGVDLVTLRPARSLFEKSFRYACTHAGAGEGAFETVDRIDAALGLSLAKIHAASNRIPLLVTGLSWVQVERLFGADRFEVPPETALARVGSVLGRPLGEIYAPEEMRYWWDPARFPQEAHPRFIHPFHAWRFGEQEIRDRVVELGLIEPGNDSPLLTNNTLIPMMVVADYRRLGYASFEPEFARLVREGRADRTFWRNVFEMLEHSARTGWMIGREVEKQARGLGLSFEEIVGQAPAGAGTVLAADAPTPASGAVGTPAGS